MLSCLVSLVVQASPRLVILNCLAGLRGLYQTRLVSFHPYVPSLLSAAQNKFAKFLMVCLKCCFWCLEKFIKFLNRNAYIMVSGRTLCCGGVCVCVCVSPPCPSRGPRTFSSFQIAIYGTNFCTSARNAFFLLMRNIIRLGDTPLSPAPSWPPFQPAFHLSASSPRL